MVENVEKASKFAETAPPRRPAASLTGHAFRLIDRDEIRGDCCLCGVLFEMCVLAAWTTTRCAEIRKNKACRSMNLNFAFPFFCAHFIKY